MDKIAILMIDEQASFRDGVRQALSRQPDFKIFDCDPSDDVMASIDANYPDVIILGSDIAAISSLELSREIVQYYPYVKVIVMSPRPNDDELFEFIKIAAVAYLDKKTPAAELYSTIRRGYRGEYPINDSVVTRPAVAQHILKQFQEIASMGRGMERIAAPLSHQENLLLTLITDCMSKKQITLTLKVSEQIVENHVRAILRKLITYDRALTALSMQHSFISVER